MKNKTKTAALCFFGQARVLDICYPYIKKHILDPIGKNRKDYDIFCCVEDDEDVHKVNLLKPTKILKIKSKDVEKILKKEVDFLNKYNYRKFICGIVGKHNPFMNMFQQTYKKKLCYNLLENYLTKNNLKYKYLIRTRFDLLPIEKLDLRKIKINSGELFAPKNDDVGSHNGIDDCFCITSDIDTFRVYCKVIDNIKNLAFKYHSISFSLPQKVYFFLEKKYKNLLVILFKENKYFTTLFQLFTMIPNGLFYKSMRKKVICDHQLLLEHLNDNGKKIKTTKIHFAIMRNDHTGILGIDR